MIFRIIQTTDRMKLKFYTHFLSINNSRILNLKGKSLYTHSSLLLKSYSSKKISIRNFRKFFKKPTLEEVYNEDKVSTSFNLIYSNGMKHYLIGAHVMAGIGVLFAFIFLSLSKDINVNDDQKFSSIDIEPMLIITTLILLSVVMQCLVLRIPIRIYNNSKTNEYKFVYYKLIPTDKKIISCFLKDVKKLDETGFLPWRNSRFEIKESEKAILLENYFRTPADLNILSGYQNPPSEDKK